MRRTFVQCADVVLELGADPAAPGGAVTIALCGTWDHAGPCRWPHHTAPIWDAESGSLRVVFTAEIDDEVRVRALIDSALADGRCVGPEGKVSRWRLTQTHAGVLNEAEEKWGRSVGESRS